MQSFGVESRFDRRTTLPFPSRSVVSGVVCAAMGIDRDEDREFLEKFAKLEVDVLELPRKTKAEKNLTTYDLCDYHTIGGGYEGTKDEILFTPRTSDGSKLKHPVQSYRYYLTDARFGVLISGDDDEIKKYEVALKDPVWGVWFGRKCCVPASPIAQGVFDDLDKAVAILCERVGCEKPRRVVRDAYSYDEEDALSYMDVPQTFARSRRWTGDEFRTRRIVVEDWDCFLERKKRKGTRNADI